MNKILPILISILAVVQAKTNFEHRGLDCVSCSGSDCNSRPDWTTTKCPRHHYAKCTTTYYTCGHHISEDCRHEYDHHADHNDLETFYQRCATEGGSNTLRSRCRLCCNDGSRTSVYKGCDTINDHDENACTTLGVKRCICDSPLCNDYDCSCSDTTTVGTTTTRRSTTRVPLTTTTGNTTESSTTTRIFSTTTIGTTAQSSTTRIPSTTTTRTTSISPDQVCKHEGLNPDTSVSPDKIAYVFFI